MYLDLWQAEKSKGGDMEDSPLVFISMVMEKGSCGLSIYEARELMEPREIVRELGVRTVWDLCLSRKQVRSLAAKHPQFACRNRRLAFFCRESLIERFEIIDLEEENGDCLECPVRLENPDSAHLNPGERIVVPDF